MVAPGVNSNMGVRLLRSVSLLTIKLILLFSIIGGRFSTSSFRVQLTISASALGASSLMQELMVVAIRQRII